MDNSYQGLGIGTGAKRYAQKGKNAIVPPEFHRRTSMAGSYWRRIRSLQKDNRIREAAGLKAVKSLTREEILEIAEQNRASFFDAIHVLNRLDLLSVVEKINFARGSREWADIHDLQADELLHELTDVASVIEVADPGRGEWSQRCLELALRLCTTMEGLYAIKKKWFWVPTEVLLPKASTLASNKEELASFASFLLEKVQR